MQNGNSYVEWKIVVDSCFVELLSLIDIIMKLSEFKKVEISNFICLNNFVKQEKYICFNLKYKMDNWNTHKNGKLIKI